MPLQQAFLPISISHDNQLFVLDFTCVFSTLKKYIPLAHLHIHIMGSQAYSYFHILAGLTHVGFGFLNVPPHHLWKNKHTYILMCFSPELNVLNVKQQPDTYHRCGREVRRKWEKRLG